MSKGLFITITIVLLGLFGIVTYYGMQALEPHTYTPPVSTAEDISSPTTSTPNISVSLPTLPVVPIKPSVPDPHKPNKVLETEIQLVYLTASTIREINSEKLFFAPKDARAFPYGKDNAFILENPSSVVRTSLWSINTATKTVTRIVGPAFGLMARWSKNGRYILAMSTDASRALSLSFIDTKTKSATPVRLVTLPSKCLVMDTAPIMYCGIPKSIPRGAALPDDYIKGIFVSSDRIIKIDFSIPKATEVWDGESEFLDIENPALIGTDLFFTNKTDDSVWKLAL